MPFTEAQRAVLTRGNYTILLFGENHTKAHASELIKKTVQEYLDSKDSSSDRITYALETSNSFDEEYKGVVENVQSPSITDGYNRSHYSTKNYFNDEKIVLNLALTGEIDFLPIDLTLRECVNPTTREVLSPISLEGMRVREGHMCKKIVEQLCKEPHDKHKIIIGQIGSRHLLKLQYLLEEQGVRSDRMHGFYVVTQQRLQEKMQELQSLKEKKEVNSFQVRALPHGDEQRVSLVCIDDSTDSNRQRGLEEGLQRVRQKRNVLDNSGPLIKNDKGYTPLTLAARQGDLPRVQYLLSAGANVNQKDGYGSTALHEAVKQNTHQGRMVVKAILNAGIDLTINNAENKSAYQVAIERDNPSAAQDINNKMLEQLGRKPPSPPRFP